MNTPKMMSSLLSAPIKLSEVDELTPGKENTVLGRAIQSLGINSPITPKTTKSKDSVSTPLTPLNSKKRLRQLSIDDLSKEEPDSKKQCQSLFTSTTIHEHRHEHDNENEKGKNPIWHRSQSESAVTPCIKRAAELQDKDPLLIGDCSRQHILPIVPIGRHQDLKEISSDTLKKVLDGEYNVKYTIIDCRYPYEYSGGHIKEAINLYTENQVYKTYFEEGRKSDSSSPHHPEILIFHCEFSQERGPRMCRNFRDWDRNMNFYNFPILHYPEMYVLHKGYKGFYEDHPDYCIPKSYVKMIDDTEQLRFCRNKCKTEIFKSKSKSVPQIKLGRSISVKKFII